MRSSNGDADGVGAVSFDMGEPPVSAGTALINKERWKQVYEHGFDAEHDDAHRGGDAGSIALVAAALILEALPDPSRYVVNDPGPDSNFWQDWVSHDKSPIEKLVIAGALVAAEIDRILRADAKREAGVRAAEFPPRSEADHA